MERQDWKILRRQTRWPARILTAAIAAIPIFSLMSMTPLSWWKADGFDTYPGTYVRMTEPDYWLCRPWHGRAPQSRADARTHVSARFGAVSGRQESNFALLLPANAHVTAIYCGAAPSAQDLHECFGQHCAVPAHFQVEDSIYTLGRGVIFSVQTKSAAPGQRNDFGFWVAWR